MDWSCGNEARRLLYARDRIRVVAAILVLRIAPWALSALRFICVWSLCVTIVPEMRADEPNLLAEYPIDGENGPLVLPIEVVQGADFAIVATRLRPLKMIIDTGSSISVFDKKHADSLGEVKEARACRAATGTMEYRAFSGPEMRIGARSVRAAGEIGCSDLAALRKSFKRDIDGWLGMDVLSLLVISIDFDEHKIRLHRSAPPNAGEPIALHRKDNILRNCVFVPGTIEGAATLEFLLDTGAIGSHTGSLDDDIFDAFLEAGTLRRTASLRHVFGAGGKAMAVVGCAGGLTLGGYRHSGAVFHRLDFPSSLGLDYLSRYKVVFDFPNRIMYLKPGSNFDHVDICDRLGLSLRRAGEHIEVKATLPGGAAAKAGIQAGDILCMLDGVDARSLKVSDARRTLSKDGEHVLDLSRREQRLRITVYTDDQ